MVKAAAFRSIRLYATQQRNIMINSAGFIDIHTHILPGLDHGARNMGEALDMIRRAVQTGVKKLVLTPHLSLDSPADLPERMAVQFRSVKEIVAASKNDIDLYLGAEIMLHPELLASIHRDKSITLAGRGKYVLIEMPAFSIPVFADTVIFELRSHGIIPIWAHPERCMDVLNDYRVVTRYRNNGVLLQLNAGSLAGNYGRQTAKTAKKMIEQGLVDLIASDAHRIDDRDVSLKDAYARVVKLVGDAKARDLFFINPLKVLE
jgi:protein-tyrosine phosphatase